MDGCSEYLNNFFSRTLMDASGWMKKKQREISNCSKVILMPNNWAQELYWL